MKLIDIEKIINEVFPKVINHYGWSKHFDTTPHIMIEDSPYDDIDDPDSIGEFCSMGNELVIYWKNIKSKEDLIRTIVHEYQHYLQSPIWMKRYYNMGYNYSDHPYEIAAYKEEENWKMFI
jgi:hypothetical protein